MLVYDFVLGRIHSRPGPHAARGLDSPVLECNHSIWKQQYSQRHTVLRKLATQTFRLIHGSIDLPKRPIRIECTISPMLFATLVQLQDA